MIENISDGRQRWCGLGWAPRVISEPTDRTELNQVPSPTPALPEPCGAALDRIHLTRQHRITAWRVSLGLCHLAPCFLLSGVRPGSPRRLPSDTFIISCSRNSRGLNPCSRRGPPDGSRLPHFPGQGCPSLTLPRDLSSGVAYQEPPVPARELHWPILSCTSPPAQCLTSLPLCRSLGLHGEGMLQETVPTGRAAQCPGQSRVENDHRGHTHSPPAAPAWL